jgi:hypothetical protein
VPFPVQLAAVPGRERELGCGCAVAEALPREIRGTSFVLLAPEFVVVRSCWRGPEHVRVAACRRAFEAATTA